MNKREKFWVKNFIYSVGIIIALGLLSWYNIVTFGNSYMQEEKSELVIFQKQIEWGLKPYLKNGDVDSIKKYCKDFENEDIKFRIFDSNKKNIASSNPSDTGELRENLAQKNNANIMKEKSPDEKVIGQVKELKSGDKTYYLELTVPEEVVTQSIMQAQQRIWIFLGLFIILTLGGIYYVLQRLKIPFDEFQNSVNKIANGDLDTKIEVPEIEVLEDLALSVKKMTQRLKLQIQKLKKLEEYKTTFIQNISHEIKTPLTAINSAVELIEDNNNLPKECYIECFGIISYQVKVINNLVNDILNLSEIETEKYNDTKGFKPIILNDMISEIINYTAEKDIPINLISSKPQISYNGDKMLLSRAVSNLISNAIRYSNSEKIDVFLDENENTVTIRIQDYGVGIPQEHQDRIFERFYRVDKARSRQFGGSGLGLAIVKNIVELHNGTIELQSEPQQGCLFTITLPNE